MRSRLTGLVTLLVSVVLLVAIFLGTDRVEQELVDDVIDDAAVEQLFFYEGLVFDESLLEHDSLDPEGELFLEPEMDEVFRSLLDLDRAGVLDGLLAAANTDRQTGIPVVLTSGQLVVVGLDGEMKLLGVDLAEFESPLVSFFTVVDLAYQASGLDQFFDGEVEDGDFFDDAPAFGVDPDVGEVRVSYDTRDFQDITWVVGADVGDIDRSVDRIRSVLSISFPVVVIAAAVLTWLLTGRALRPVSRITEQVGAITAGTLHERVPEPGTGDEIDGLASTMNGMLDRLEQDDRRLRQFVSDASHELRSPVAVIRNEAEVALRRLDDTSVDELAKGVLDEAVRLQRIVEDLLVLARGDERRASRHTASIDLDDVVLAEAGRARRLPVDISGVSAGRVGLDVDDASRLARHLLDNAVRHAESRAVVGLHTEPDGESVALWVDDDGPGIEPNDRDRIFERFARLEQARTRDSGGAGLGLAVVAAVVSEASGSISVVESPLGGARFVVRLPASH